MKYCLQDEIGFCDLVQHVGDDTSVVNSARVSFGKHVSSIAEQDKKLIKFLLEHDHGTPLEHNSLTFLIKCPLFVARQWDRHRIGISINEISARYVEVQDEFYIPASFRAQSQSNRQASIHTDNLNNLKLQNIFQASIEASFRAYQELLAEGVAREQARAVLPLATYTQFYWTCNLRSLLHFVRLRDHKDAQWEIQQYAQSMIEQAKNIFPETIKIYNSLHIHSEEH